MKTHFKLTLLLVLACFFVLPSSAQKMRRDHEQEIAVGVTGGMSFSRIKFLPNIKYRLNEVGEQSFRPSYRFGVAFRYIHQNHFGLQAELNYAKAGWSELYYEDSGMSMVNDINMQNVEIGREINYIEMPILAHIFFGKRKVRFFVELGMQLSANVHYGELEWNIPEDDSRRLALSDDDPRLYDNYSKMNYGLAGGLGFDFLFGKCHAILGSRYTFGFKDLYGNKKGDMFQKSNTHLLNATMTILWSVKKFSEKSRKQEKFRNDNEDNQ